MKKSHRVAWSLTLLLIALLATPVFQAHDEWDGIPLIRTRGRGLRFRPPSVPSDSESSRDFRASAHHLNPALRNDLPRSQLLQSLANAVNSNGMISDLNAISTVIPTRYFSSAGMKTATQYVLSRFVGVGLDDAYFDTFSEGGSSLRNVVGIKRGSQYPGRIYIICGHLDSTSNRFETEAPGAEDNGSGSVGVVEAARLLAPLQTQSTIYFICLTAEEVGDWGAEHIAQRADQEKWDLRGVLNMDMIGYDEAGTPQLWVEGFPKDPGSVALMDRLTSAARMYTDLSVYRCPEDGWGSDHVTFHEHGYPAVLAIDYDWDHYTCYHRTCDTVSNIVTSQLRKMTATVTVATAQLAGLQTALGSIAGIADRIDSPKDAGIRIELIGTGYAPVSSSTKGAFSIRNLLPGRYQLQATATGYRTAMKKVTIVAGHTTRITISLTRKSASGSNERSRGSEELPND